MKKSRRVSRNIWYATHKKDGTYFLAGNHHMTRKDLIEELTFFGIQTKNYRLKRTKVLVVREK